LQYVRAGDNQNALASMCSDIMKHPETQHHAETNKLAMNMLITGQLSTPQQMETWINGYQ
jgi:hypothetical protein